MLLAATNSQNPAEVMSHSFHINNFCQDSVFKHFLMLVFLFQNSEGAADDQIRRAGKNDSHFCIFTASKNVIFSKRSLVVLCSANLFSSWNTVSLKQIFFFNLGGRGRASTKNLRRSNLRPGENAHLGTGKTH